MGIYPLEDIMQIVRSYDDKPVKRKYTLLVVVFYQYDVKFYTTIIQRDKSPPTELPYIKSLDACRIPLYLQKEKMTYEDGMALMKESGLDSMPVAALKFCPRNQDQIAGASVARSMA